MTMYLYRPDDPYADENGFVEATKALPKNAVYVISDEMAPTRHMADGHHYTSKAKFRAATKAHGCIEYGNENLLKPRKPITLDRGKRRDDIRKAIQDLKYDRVNKAEWYNRD